MRYCLITILSLFLFVKLAYAKDVREPITFCNRVDAQVYYIAKEVIKLWQAGKLTEEDCSAIQGYIRTTLQTKETYIEVLIAGSNDMGREDILEALKNLNSALYVLTAKATSLGITILEEQICPIRRKGV